MPSSTGLAGSIDLQSTDDQTIDVSSTGKLRIKPEYEALINQSISEHELEIIELQANASITPIDHDSLISDTFSDATGYKDSVQTGMTTTTFSTNQYIRVNVNEGLKDSQTGTGTTETVAYDVNNKRTSASFTAGSSYSISRLDFEIKRVGSPPNIRASIYATSGGVPTGASLGDSDYVVASSIGTTLAYIPFYFSTPVALTSGVKYAVVLSVVGDATSTTNNYNYNINGSNGAEVLSRYNSSWASYLGRTTNFKTYESGSETTKITDISLPTISGVVTHTELICNTPLIETGSSVTYKLKNATQSDDNLAKDIKNALVNLTSNPTGIEIQHNPRALRPTSGYPSAKTYCLKLWKA